MSTGALPILVDAPRDASHLDVLMAVGRASLAAFDFTDPTWRSWYMRSQTKSVRVARTRTQLERALADLRHTSVSVGDVTAHAFFPMNTDDHPSIKAARVSGLVREVTTSESGLDDAAAVVYVASDLGMSTGKAAAQAAHAYCGLAGFARGEQIGLVWCPSAQFPKTRLVEIKDNGLTEIAPGSLTAVAVRRTR